MARSVATLLLFAAVPVWAGECPARENAYTDCGYYGIGRAECESRGCCYDPGSPMMWCYPSSTPTPTPAPTAEPTPAPTEVPTTIDCAIANDKLMIAQGELKLAQDGVVAACPAAMSPAPAAALSSAPAVADGPVASSTELLVTAALSAALGAVAHGAWASRRPGAMREPLMAA